MTALNDSITVDDNPFAGIPQASPTVDDNPFARVPMATATIDDNPFAQIPTAVPTVDDNPFSRLYQPPEPDMIRAAPPRAPWASVTEPLRDAASIIPFVPPSERQWMDDLNAALHTVDPEDEKRFLNADGTLRPPPNFAKDFGRSVDQAQEMGYGLSLMALDLVGAKNTKLAKAVSEKLLKNRAQLDANPAGIAAKNIGEGMEQGAGSALARLRQTKQFIGQSATEQVPMLIASMGGAVAGKKIAGVIGEKAALKVGQQTAAKLAGESIASQPVKLALAKAAGERAMVPVLKKAVLRGEAAGAFAPSYAMEAGSMFAEKAKDNHRGAAEALKTAVLAIPAAAADSIQPVLAARRLSGGSLSPLAKIFSELRNGKAAGRLGNATEAAVEGALTEAPTEYFQTAIEQIDKFSSETSSPEEFAAKLFSDEAESERRAAAATGAAGGGVFGGGVGLTQKTGETSGSKTPEGTPEAALQTENDFAPLEQASSKVKTPLDRNSAPATKQDLEDLKAFIQSGGNQLSNVGTTERKVDRTGESQLDTAEKRERDDETFAGVTIPPISPSGKSALSLEPKAISEIIRDLSRGFNIPIRFGRLTAGGGGATRFAGFYKSFSNLIGSKKPNDILTVSHEIGHKLDDLFIISGEPAIRGELLHLGDNKRADSMSSWTPSKNKRYRLGEGVAELLRYYITKPDEARAMAPTAMAHLETILKANPELESVVKTAQADVDAWKKAPQQARLRSSISIGKDRSKSSYSIDKFVSDTIDDLHYVKLASEAAKKESGKALAASKDPYVLARLLRGSNGMADSFIRRGVADFQTKEVALGTSFNDALKPIEGRIADFRDYIVARQAKEMHKQRKETGLIPSDVDFVVNKFAGDTAFNKAFDDVKKWSDSLIQYSVDAGYLSPASASAIRQMNKEYVPFHRVFEVGAGEMATDGGPGRGLNAVAKAFKERTGSRRDIVDPLETYMKNAYTVIHSAEKNAVNLAIADLADVKGMGRWVERIATPQEAARYGVEHIRKQLETAGADMSGIPNDLILTFYSDSQRSPFGENVIKVNRAGKLEFYRLKSDLYRAVQALDVDQAGTLVRMLSAPSNLLRAGTTLTPDFALSNAIRDTVSAAVISRFGSLPFQSTIKGIGALLKNPKIVAEWAAAGGKNSVEVNYFDRATMEKFLRERITKDLTPTEQATVVLKSPLAALRALSATFEEATRIGEYKTVHDKLVKKGVSEGEARRRAAFESRDLQDFAKSGAKMRILKQMTAFFNAQIQGNYRLYTAFKEKPIETTLKGVAFITTAKLLEFAVNHDDEDYWDRPQWERDLFFLIPYGKDDNGRTKFMRLPTPFEAGVIFGTVPGRFLQYLKQQHPQEAKEVAAMLLRQSIPNPIPQFAMTALEANAGDEGYSFFKGHPIVPESIARNPKDLQFNEQTSLTAKQIGKHIGKAPMKVDHVISSLTGGLGRQTINQVVDRGISAATGEPRPKNNSYPGARFFAGASGYSSEAVNRFYERLAVLRAENARIELTDESSGINIDDLEDMESAARAMAKIRKEIQEETDQKEKQRLRLEIVEIAKSFAANRKTE